MTTSAPVIAASSPEVVDSPERRTWLLVATILGVALVARVALVLATRDLRLVDDPADYHRLALNVARGHGFGDTVLSAGGGATAFRAPLYPFLLGAFYDVFGVSVTAARLVQAVIGTGTVALIGLLAFRLFGQRIGIIAAAMAAVYPPLILSGGSLLTESIATPLMLGAILLALEHRRRGGLRWAVASGVATGLAVLTRENSFLLLVPLALLVWDGRRRWSARALVAPVTVLIAAGVVVAPWTIRNAVTMDALIPVTDSAGYVWGGVYNEVSDHNPRFPAAFVPPSAVPTFAPLFADRSLDENALADALQARAKEYARAHPTYVGKVVFWNTYRLFDLGGTGFARVVGASLGFSARLSDLAVFSWYLVAALAVVGLFVAPLRRTPWALWLAPVLFWATTVLALGTFRYRAPLEPFILCLAACGLATAFERVGRRPPRPRRGSDGSVVAAR
jgi:4-amino-4-deoxy-L-arabinose transferase-like glycosyltransferase